MRISDWSSDVCSSDLGLELPRAAVGAATGRVGEHDLGGEGGARDPVGPGEEHPGGERRLQRRGRGIGTDVLHEVELRSEHRALVVEGHAGQAVLVERSEEHTSEPQSLMRSTYDVIGSQKKKTT